MDRMPVFLNLVVWAVAIVASCDVWRKLNAAGILIKEGSKLHVYIHVRWPAIVAAVAWLWIIAGCLRY